METPKLARVGTAQLSPIYLTLQTNGNTIQPPFHRIWAHCKFLDWDTFLQGPSHVHQFEVCTTLSKGSEEKQ